MILAQRKVRTISQQVRYFGYLALYLNPAYRKSVLSVYFDPWFLPAGFMMDLNEDEDDAESDITALLNALKGIEQCFVAGK